MPKCPMCSACELTLPHFLIWCPVLDSVRKESGLYSFMVENCLMEKVSEAEAIKMYLEAKGNDPDVIKVRGKALIQMRNHWYKKANYAKDASSKKRG